MRVAKLLLLLMTIVPVVAAQSSSARVQLRGTVVDAQSLPVPNATVTVRNADFGATRTTTTDASGNFLFSALPAGTYMLSASGGGLTTKKPVRVQITVGSSQQLTVRVEPEAVASSTTVTARGGTVEGNTVAPAVNKQEPVGSNTIAGLTVTYLPNRNRDFAQMQQLASGTVEDASGGTSILGQSAMYSTAAIDGAEITDPLFGGERGSGRAQFFFPQVAVREFQIVKSGATAETGATNAGFINIATKEGSNKFRGELFYIGRAPWMTSHDAFGHSLDNLQNEFGGALGGPIRKDKAFFYISAEQDFLRIPTFTQFAPQAPGTVIPASLAALEGATAEHSRPTAIFSRVDFILPRQNSLSLQLDDTRTDADTVDSGSTRTLAAAAHRTNLSGNSAWLRANLTTVISDFTVNQVLAQYGRETFRSLPRDSSIAEDINGFGTLGGNDLTLRSGSKRFQLSDDVAFTHRTSAINVGASYLGSPVELALREFGNPRLDYASLADFNSGLLRRFRQSFVIGDPRMTQTVQRIGAYASVRHDLRAKLTLTAGLRVDSQFNPAPVPNDAAQWQPRLGLAWNPRPTLVIRASAGFYDAPTPAALYARAFIENGANTLLADTLVNAVIITGPAMPPQLAAAPAFSARRFTVAPGFRDPRSFQAALAVEKEINKAVTFSSSFVRNSTWDLPRLIDANLAPPTSFIAGMPVFPVTRPDPNAGQALTYQSAAHSDYNGWLNTLSVQLPKRSSLTANYTLARTRDDHPLANALDENTLLDPFAPRLDAGDSALDARHVFTLSGVINLPAGFKMNPLLIARSGLPYSAVTGFDQQNDANDRNDRAVLPASFGGSPAGTIAARNSLRQPAFFNLDLRFVKDFTLKGEGHHLDLFLDVLNVTGATDRNFGPEAVSVFGAAASPVFSAGQPLYAPNTARFGSARQVQFTARLVAF